MNLLIFYNSWHFWLYYFFSEIGQDQYSEEMAIVETLSRRLEDELRLVRKENFLEEILLPHGLTVDIAKKVFQLAELEPCGLRGCLLYIEFELKEEKRKVSSIKCDPSIPSTFELYLTLRQATNGWNSFLPRFWKWVLYFVFVNLNEL